MVFQKCGAKGKREKKIHLWFGKICDLQITIQNGAGFFMTFMTKKATLNSRN